MLHAIIAGEPHKISKGGEGTLYEEERHGGYAPPVPDSSIQNRTYGQSSRRAAQQENREPEQDIEEPASADGMEGLDEDLVAETLIGKRMSCRPQSPKKDYSEIIAHLLERRK